MDNANRTGLGFRISPHLVLGFFALAAGTLLILDNLGLIAAWDYLRYWPVVLILVGLAKLAQPHGNRLAGAIFALAGLWLLADELEIAEFDWDYVFPVMLLLVGLHLVGRAVSRGAGRPRRADTSPDLDAFAIMGGVNRSSAAQQFRGGSATAVMGGCELDLRQAAIAEGKEAVIDTFALWGGVEILVPESWTVELKGIPIMGAFEDNTRHPVGGPVQRLVVKGVAIMGGVEVKNHHRREKA
jgi:hypothetical protein